MPTVSHTGPYPEHTYDHNEKENLKETSTRTLKETNDNEDFNNKIKLTNNLRKRIKNDKKFVESKNKIKLKNKTNVTDDNNVFKKKLNRVHKERDTNNELGNNFDKIVESISFFKCNSKTKPQDEVTEKSKKISCINNTVLNKTLKRRNKESERNNTNHINEERKRENIKKPKWRISSGVLVTLVIFNLTGSGDAVEEISSNSLASLFGYETSCWLGAEERPCTLAIACWLRGGTRVRGCGGWLFACCQPPSSDPYTSHSIPSSDWSYKVSPPRLRQVPKRNVMPNNVFRRRVDDDVTQTDCGVASNRILQKRIIGGREARFAEFPWQAHVRISEFQCGGVLVSQRYVATAAHCVSRAHIRDIVVWLGALDTSAGSRTARKVGVHQKILHPLFQFRMTQPDRFDIALLKLARPVSFSRFIRAICLPESAMPLRGRSALIAGWGKTDATDTHTGTNMLRSATVPILSKEQCIAWHQSKQISVEIHSEMICAGHSDGHQDACLGDSGGPLIVPENGRYYLVGITSAGFGCGVDHQPGIYHNVQVTANWIRGVLHEETLNRETMNLGDSYYDRSNFL